MNTFPVSRLPSTRAIICGYRECFGGSKVTRMYPADPPEVYFKNEFSAQSILQRSNKSSVNITDGETEDFL